MNRLTHLFRRMHNVLGLVVGAQVLLWIASGFFFSLRPIEEVRGEHLLSSVHQIITGLPQSAAPVDNILAATSEPVIALKVKPWLGRPVWEVETKSGKAMFDYVNGQLLTPLSEADARNVAEAEWTGDGTLEVLALVDEAPPEAGRGAGRPMWQAEFAGADTATIWIDPQVGDVAAVRTGWWRAFDLFWGLHIMDWTNRETFSTWWMKLFSFGALVLTLAGIWLVIDRLVKGRLLK